MSFAGVCTQKTKQQAARMSRFINEYKKNQVEQQKSYEDVSFISISNKQFQQQKEIIENENYLFMIEGFLWSQEKLLSHSQILSLFQEKGISFLQNLQGTFRLAIYDKKDHNFYLAVDKLNTRPLYYAQENGDIYFSSEIKGFFGVLKEKSINYKAVQEFIYLTVVTGSKTLLNEVVRLEPGSYLVFSTTSRKSFNMKYANYNFHHKEKTSYKSQYAELKERYEQSVKHGISIANSFEEPISSTLSGGRDSRAAVSMMKRLGVKKFLTGTYGDKRHLDQTIAKKFAASLQLPHISSKFNNGNFLLELENEIIDASECMYSTTDISRMLSLVKQIPRSKRGLMFLTAGTDNLFSDDLVEEDTTLTRKDLLNKEIHRVISFLSYNIYYEKMIQLIGKKSLEQSLISSVKKTIKNEIEQEHDNSLNILEKLDIFYRNLIPTSTFRAIETQLEFYPIGFDLIDFVAHIPYKHKLVENYAPKIYEDLLEEISDSKHIPRNKSKKNYYINLFSQGLQRFFHIDIPFLSRAYGHYFWSYFRQNRKLRNTMCDALYDFNELDKAEIDVEKLNQFVKKFQSNPAKYANYGQNIFNLYYLKKWFERYKQHLTS